MFPAVCFLDVDSWCDPVGPGAGGKVCTTRPSQGLQAVLRQATLHSSPFPTPTPSQPLQRVGEAMVWTDDDMIYTSATEQALLGWRGLVTGCSCEMRQGFRMKKTEGLGDLGALPELPQVL